MWILDCSNIYECQNIEMYGLKYSELCGVGNIAVSYNRDRECLNVAELCVYFDRELWESGILWIMGI